MSVINVRYIALFYVPQIKIKYSIFQYVLCTITFILFFLEPFLNMGYRRSRVNRMLRRDSFGVGAVFVFVDVFVLRSVLHIE